MFARFDGQDGRVWGEGLYYMGWGKVVGLYQWSRAEL